MDGHHMNKSEKRNLMILGSFISIFIFLFIIFYRGQERETLDKLSNCRFITLIKPLRMPDSGTLYFSFRHSGKIFKGKSIGIGAEDLGMWYSKNLILNSRFFIEVNCHDFNTNKILWEIPVPDTLEFVPLEGWKEVPYGLDTYKTKPFNSFSERYGIQ